MRLHIPALNYKGGHVAPVHTPFSDCRYTSPNRHLLVQTKSFRPKEQSRAAQVCLQSLVQRSHV